MWNEWVDLSPVLTPRSPVDSTPMCERLAQQIWPALAKQNKTKMYPQKQTNRTLLWKIAKHDPIHTTLHRVGWNNAMLRVELVHGAFQLEVHHDILVHIRVPNSMPIQAMPMPMPNANSMLLPVALCHLPCHGLAKPTFRWNKHENCWMFKFRNI